MPTKHPIALYELAALLGGQLSFEGVASVWIFGVASIAEAGPKEVTFLGNPKYLPALRESKAAAALVPEDFSGGGFALLDSRCESVARFCPAC
jgi:UDP-3-O-[3-hydroxymyristoyl] glucosamine N-acyltransferase